MINQEVTTVIPAAIVMPAVSPEDAVKAWDQYEALKKAIAKPEDIQVIEGKNFLKKSYWRKVATFFNLSTEVVDESREQVGKTFVWHFTVKAVANNGRFAIGVGSCDAFEKASLIDGKYMKKGKVTKWGKTEKGKSFPLEFELEPATPNSLHNIRSTAETRATNRAISNLVGGGEVSAEEVTASQDVEVVERVEKVDVAAKVAEDVAQAFDQSAPNMPDVTPVDLGVCKKCGAPNVVSKKTGGVYCSALCWNK